MFRGVVALESRDDRAEDLDRMGRLDFEMSCELPDPQRGGLQMHVIRTDVAPFLVLRSHDL